MTSNDSIAGKSLKGLVPESWLCADCGVNTAPGCLTRKEAEIVLARHGSFDIAITAETEVYTVTTEVWLASGLEYWSGCLCVRCLEKRIGRRLKPEDFVADDALNLPHLPATRRLRKRRAARA